MNTAATLINRALLRMTARRPVREIRLDGKRYMERHWLGRAFGLTFYLHRYIAADGERAYVSYDQHLSLSASVDWHLKAPLAETLRRRWT